MIRSCSFAQLSRLSLALFTAAATFFSEARADERRPWTRPTAWASMGERERAAALAFGEGYRQFLGWAKTEREAITIARAAASSAGFGPLGARAAPGAKLWFEENAKMAALVVVGRRPLAEGVRVVAGHVDAVRLDLKPRPVYEDTNLALLETQYYGRITYSQWLARPLALHGVALRADGTKVELRVGSEPSEPVFAIPDVLVHLRARVRDESGDRLPAEKLDPIAASLPADPEPSELVAGEKRSARFQRGFLELLRKRFGLGAAELEGAELSLVPAEAPRSVGLDGALVGGYGQDGRAGVYAALRAILELTGPPEHTAVVALFDRQEIGSVGVTGARSGFLPRVLGALLRAGGAEANEQLLREVFAKSQALSADATSAVEPQWKKLHDRRNGAYLGAGPVLEPSSGTSALRHAVRRATSAAGIPLQLAEFSRSLSGRRPMDSLVPELAALGLSSARLAVPIASLHSPFELASKIDVFLAARAFAAFLSAH